MKNGVIAERATNDTVEPFSGHYITARPFSSRASSDESDVNATNQTLLTRERRRRAPWHDRQCHPTQQFQLSASLSRCGWFAKRHDLANARGDKRSQQHVTGAQLCSEAFRLVLRRNSVALPRRHLGKFSDPAPP
jgi:hypothetical protein